MLLDSSAPSGPTWVADELGVSGSEVLRLCDFSGGGFSASGSLRGPRRAYMAPTPMTP